MIKTNKLFIAGLIFFVFLVLISYSCFVEPNFLIVNKQELKINNWNAAFNGFKIVMISDIHGGSNNVTEEKIRQIVNETNAQDADIVVLLGDYVSKKYGSSELKMPISVICENLRGIKSKYGVFAVLGNHDPEAGDQAVVDALQNIGYRVLQNEIVNITKDGQTLIILGLEDQMKILSWKGYSDQLRKIINDNNTAGNIIVLEHSPDVFPIITAAYTVSPDIKLMLAGHTHGGQVWLPIVGTPIIPSSYGQKYAYGKIFENNTNMFVTSGVGTSILPFRFMMPPEIAVLTINGE